MPVLLVTVTLKSPAWARVGTTGVVPRLIHNVSKALPVLRLFNFTMVPFDVNVKRA
jgi:hypothetical protein